MYQAARASVFAGTEFIGRFDGLELLDRVGDLPLLGQDIAQRNGQVLSATSGRIQARSDFSISAGRSRAISKRYL